jgi:sugar/nucleoside kinase (ribokinase family)
MFCLAERSVTKQNITNLSETDWNEVASFANAVGALATKHVSAVGSLPTKGAVLELLKSQTAG